MKKNQWLIVFALSGLTILPSYAQFGSIDQLLKGSKADANYLAQGYLTPAMNTFGTGLNQGWYNTAANHKKFGVDLTVSVSSISSPSSDDSYFVDNNKLQNLRVADAGSPVTAPTFTKGGANAPTLFGSDAVTPRYYFKVDPTNNTFVDGPTGSNVKKNIPLGGIPVPMINLGIGIPGNTDLRFRYAATNSSGTNVSLWGVGVLHDVKQHIPGIKMLPFDLSAFVGYTSFKAETTFGPGQTGIADFTATTIQGLVSKKFAVLTLYGAAGYNIANGSFKAKGTFDSGAPGVTLVDPVSISSSTSGARFTAGMRLKLAVFTFHGDYTFQKYNTLTVGFGISVR
ncbi:MAG TPA: hypothetical protein PLX35_05625 [Cyclobacteriaceae bacterium]|nr:hypothetical protein [Cyclobacteriaceae bacterium]